MLCPSMIRHQKKNLQDQYNTNLINVNNFQARMRGQKIEKIATDPEYNYFLLPFIVMLCPLSRTAIAIFAFRK